MEDMNIKENIKNTINCLADCFDEQNKEFYNEFQNKHQANFSSPEEFYFSVIYPFENYTSGLLQTNFGKNFDIEFLCERQRFVEIHFQGLIRKFEGFCCCADKSRHIVNRLFDYFKDNRPLDFDYSNKKAYWLPEKIFKTPESILSFYKAIQNLYYGNSEMYLQELLKISQTPELLEVQNDTQS